MADLNQVDTTIASAGTGKTTSLVRLIADGIESGAEPERILGTTFTIKAADELIERARANLVRQGRIAEATRLLNARLGTINSVCGKLVGEFALDLGRSPSTEVIGEDSEAAIFATAADAAIRQHADTLLPLAIRFSIDEKDGGWRKQVHRLITLARANGIAADGLQLSAERSKATLADLLPPASTDGGALDAALLAGVRTGISALSAISLTGGGGKALACLRSIEASLARGEVLAWCEWSRLAKLTAGVKETPLMQEAIDAAAAHARHPRLHAELMAYIDGCFACAADALDAYQAFKNERGLLDFTDQETLALQALRSPALQERLAERIDMVFVDEVQDSSPLQIAIFTELARIARRSTWVGDPKQAIYGFRNTDSRLTLAASAAAAASTGGTPGILSTSYRSRPSLVSFFNDAFTPAFLAMGMTAEECRFSSAKRSEVDGTPPPLSVWVAGGKNAPDRAGAVAAGIREALATPSDWPVAERESIRDLRLGDVAVLCRTHADIENVASALSALGIAVAVEHGDLFTVPEIQLAIAALRWTADQSDLVALAEMVRLTDENPAGEIWLAAALESAPREALAALLPFSSRLAELREQQMALTPAELLDAVMECADLVPIACRWGDARARIERLETLRGLARTYEEECTRLRSPATVGGLVLWLKGRECKRPTSLDTDAVQVMTYHRAKGLEWPMVVMLQLEKPPRFDPFDMCAESDGDIDWQRPLDGRWLRFWPQPYGLQKAKTHLVTSAENSAIGQAVAKRAREESVRLLYVGMTRARDHLVLVRPEKGALQWLGDLSTSEDVTHVVMPSSATDGISAGEANHPARFKLLWAVDPETRPSPQLYISRSVDPKMHLPLRLRPSSSVSEIEFEVASEVSLGARLPLSGEPDMQMLGQAFHAIFASDDRQAGVSTRAGHAAAVLQRWGVAQLLPHDCIQAVDRLWAAIEERYRPTRIRREVPVRAYANGQLISGVIDLLVETDDGFVIIDHKSFPGTREKAIEKAIGYAQQLALYVRAVEAASGRRCLRTVIHLPITGMLVEIRQIPTAEMPAQGLAAVS